MIPTRVRRAAAALLALACGAIAAAQSASRPATAAFDHGAFDALLRRHVAADGGVRYEELKKEAEALDAYIASLAGATPSKLPRQERLALYINAYNACTLRLVLDHWPLKSIMDIPEAQRWKDARWRVGGRTLSLDALENEVLRREFDEPRIHFAINCASVGCPPLRAEAYVGPRIEQQLQQQAERVHRDPRWCRVEAGGRRVALTKIYEWYGADFGKGADTAVRYAARFCPPLRAALDAGKTPEVTWIDWDWSLNRAEKERP